MNNQLKRGCLLNGIFALLAIGSIFNIFSYFFAQYTAKILPQVPQSDPITIGVSTVVGIVVLASLIGTLKWNKTSMYVLVLVNVVSGVYAIASMGAQTATIIGALVGIAIPAFYSYSLLKILKSQDENGQNN